MGRGSRRRGQKRTHNPVPSPDRNPTRLLPPSSTSGLPPLMIDKDAIGGLDIVPQCHSVFASDLVCSVDGSVPPVCPVHEVLEHRYGEGVADPFFQHHSALTSVQVG